MTQQESFDDCKEKKLGLRDNNSYLLVHLPVSLLSLDVKRLISILQLLRLNDHMYVQSYGSSLLLRFNYLFFVIASKCTVIACFSTSCGIGSLIKLCSFSLVLLSLANLLMLFHCQLLLLLWLSTAGLLRTSVVIIHTYTLLTYIVLLLNVYYYVTMFPFSNADY